MQLPLSYVQFGVVPRMQPVEAIASASVAGHSVIAGGVVEAPPPSPPAPSLPAASLWSADVGAAGPHAIESAPIISTVVRAMPAAFYHGP
jgi:hypothetical protein